MLNKSPIIKVPPAAEVNAQARESASPFLWTVAYRMNRKATLPPLKPATLNVGICPFNRTVADMQEVEELCV